MTIQEILVKATKTLNKEKIPNPHFEAEFLLSFILDRFRENILSHKEDTISQKNSDKLWQTIKKRVQGLPIAYITGSQEFYGLEFAVNKHVLIPRPESEQIVDEAKIEINNLLKKRNKIFIIDVGTGSGCLLITLAKLFSGENLKYMGIDVSLPALRVAQSNAKKHGVSHKIKFEHGDLLNPVMDYLEKINMDSASRRTKIIILANLPYLTARQIKNSPTIQAEPKLALDGGKNGLKYYKKLFSQISRLNNKIYLIAEIDPEQTEEIKKAAINLLDKKTRIIIKKDLAGFGRLFISREV